MINLLLRLKSLVPTIAIFIAITSILYGVYWRAQYTKSQAVVQQQIKKNASLEASQELLQSSVKTWKKAASDYDKQLKEKDKVIAKENVNSKERVKYIIKKEYSDDCATAITQGMSTYSELVDNMPGFNWTNNIP